jgi:hypothetical protein
MTLLGWSYIGTILSGAAGLVGLGIAIFQLGGLRKSLKQANLMAMFQIEFELSRRKERMVSIRQQAIEKTSGQVDISVSDGFVKEALEDYYNIFDRLCFFILKRYFNEEDFRLEYRDMLFKTIENDESKFSGIGSPYQNMVKLYRKWKELV